MLSRASWRAVSGASLSFDIVNSPTTSVAWEKPA